MPLNSLLIRQFGKFGLIFDTRPCEIDDLAVSSRQIFEEIDSRNRDRLKFLAKVEKKSKELLTISSAHQY